MFGDDKNAEPIIIGERLTSGNKSVRKALLDRDRATIADLAIRQAQAGADYLDICASSFGPECEPDHLARLVLTAQETTDLPLSLDSQNPNALRAALLLCRRPPVLNSFSGMITRPKDLLSVIEENASAITSVVAVCLDTWDTRPSPDKRIDIASRLADDIVAAGVP